MSSLFLALMAIFIGVGFGILAWTVLDMVFSQERVVARRVRSMSAGPGPRPEDLDELAKPFTERVVYATGSRISAAMRALMPSNYLARVTDRIRLAGPRPPFRAETFTFMRIVLGLVGLALGTMLAVRRDVSPIVGVAAVMLGVCIGLWGPSAWLSGRIAARQKSIRLSLPDMLDMLTVSVQAGLGFDASLARVVSSTRSPLAEEFAVVLQEIQGGLPRRDALRHLAEHTGVSELSSFILAIVQAETFGVSIANVLHQESKELRTMRRQRAQELAQEAPAKMVFPLVLCTLPATMIVVVGPAVIRIFAAFGLRL